MPPPKAAGPSSDSKGDATPSNPHQTCPRAKPCEGRPDARKRARGEEVEGSTLVWRFAALDSAVRANRACIGRMLLEKRLLDLRAMPGGKARVGFKALMFLGDAALLDVCSQYEIAI